jgi:ATP-binding protein involved in chromosome partitioning
MDPRVVSIEKRLAPVGRTVAVTGGKGGIGKSLVSSTLAARLASRGAKVGLFDLDLTAPCDHLILGVERQFPTEEFGIDPRHHHGVAFMSIASFSGETPAPLRGDDFTNALVELLAITRWPELDLLLIDMPPGLSNATLDVMRWIPQAESLLVSTPSRVVVETVRRLLGLLTEQQCPILGVLENMRRNGEQDGPSRRLAEQAGVPFLGAAPYDPEVESALGDPRQLAKTRLAGALETALGSRLETR